MDVAISLSGRLGAPLGLLVINLDGFKAVNGSYGHAAGDQVVKTVAERILSVVRRADKALYVAKAQGKARVILSGDGKKYQSQ